MHFLLLPTDVLLHSILPRLSASDILNVRATCLQLLHVVDTEWLWRMLLEHRKLSWSSVCSCGLSALRKRRELHKQNNLLGNLQDHQDCDCDCEWSESTASGKATCRDILAHDSLSMGIHQAVSTSSSADIELSVMHPRLRRIVEMGPSRCHQDCDGILARCIQVAANDLSSRVRRARHRYLCWAPASDVKRSRCRHRISHQNDKSCSLPSNTDDANQSKDPEPLSPLSRLGTFLRAAAQVAQVSLRGIAPFIQQPASETSGVLKWIVFGPGLETGGASLLANILHCANETRRRPTSQMAWDLDHTQTANEESFDSNTATATVASSAPFTFFGRRMFPGIGGSGGGIGLVLRGRVPVNLVFIYRNEYSQRQLPGGGGASRIGSWDMCNNLRSICSDAHGFIFVSDSADTAALSSTTTSCSPGTACKVAHAKFSARPRPMSDVDALEYKLLVGSRPNLPLLGLHMTDGDSFSSSSSTKSRSMPNLAGDLEDASLKRHNHHGGSTVVDIAENLLEWNVHRGNWWLVNSRPDDLESISQHMMWLADADMRVR